MWDGADIDAAADIVEIWSHEETNYSPDLLISWLFNLLISRFEWRPYRPLALVLPLTTPSGTYPHFHTSLQGIQGGNHDYGDDDDGNDDDGDGDGHDGDGHEFFHILNC